MVRGKRIIILYTANLCQRVDDLFNLNLWVNEGYQVEYWDLSDITFFERLEPIMIEGIKEVKFVNKVSFKRAVKECTKDSIFLMWFGCSYKTSFIFRVLSKYKAQFGVICNGLKPTVSVPVRNRFFTFGQLVISLKEKFTQFMLKSPLYKPATYSFLTASSGYHKYKVSKETVFALCNSGDYEAMMRMKTITGSCNTYFLFLDQYLPYHNDSKLIGSVKMDKNKYYYSLNTFFSLIEKTYKIPVVIAAHPSAKKYKEENPFNGRQIYFNRTMSLALNSKAIIGHFTTALSVAVVYNKPVILLSSDEIEIKRPIPYEEMKALHEVLSAPIVNMDHLEGETISLPVINIEKYNNYKYKYLTNPETENYNNFENISKIINTNI